MLIFLTPIFGCTSGQNTKFNEPSPEHLKNYSYPVFVFHSVNQVANGTGFLYKSGNKSYLITNYHIRGMNPFEQKIFFNADAIYLKYSNAKSLQFETKRIEIVKTDKIRIFTIDQDLDLFGIELPVLPNASLYFINDFIDKKYFYKKPDSIIVFGYPVDQSKKDSFNSKINTFKGDYRDDFNDLEPALKNKYPTEIQYIKKVLPIFRKTYFLSHPMADHGYSGSPVFGKFNIGNKVEYKFMGVVFGWEGLLQKTWAVQPRAFLDWANSKLH